MKPSSVRRMSSRSSARSTIHFVSIDDETLDYVYGGKRKVSRSLEEDGGGESTGDALADAPVDPPVEEPPAETTSVDDNQLHENDGLFETGHANVDEVPANDGVHDDFVTDGLPVNDGVHDVIGHDGFPANDGVQHTDFGGVHPNELPVEPSDGVVHPVDGGTNMGEHPLGIKDHVDDGLHPAGEHGGVIKGIDEASRPPGVTPDGHFVDGAHGIDGHAVDQGHVQAGATVHDDLGKVVGQHPEGTTTTEHHEDGSTTTTEHRADGTATVTDLHANGTATVTDHHADGATTTTEHHADGGVTVHEDRADGSHQLSQYHADGSSSHTTDTTKNGITNSTTAAYDKDGHLVSQTQSVTDSRGLGREIVTDANGKVTADRITTFDHDGTTPVTIDQQAGRAALEQMLTKATTQGGDWKMEITSNPSRLNGGSSVGHAFVTLTSPDGQKIVAGYYPTASLYTTQTAGAGERMVGPGTVVLGTEQSAYDHSINGATLPRTVTADQAAAALRQIQSVEAAPGTYKATPGGNIQQCQTFAQSVYQAATGERLTSQGGGGSSRGPIDLGILRFWSTTPDALNGAIKSRRP